ncbi:Na/Pi cotransporter family protein [Alicyclobacillus tolerans]|uniref:Phosphate:Na+ symporter n=2 Tax=Alicyclobacillus tolerans TaxID=90970 RepID=A0A1M6JX45_9BACL|nr:MULTISPECIES: Na/Pi symporter [Alicyclobacillus]MDP9727376.1 phosphate:Na+ symporter [Alicyclobacillus tengchongensis]QRF23114.1 Na/Pi cotransporter family protein [Alicyclobacillus sp. TC]SHJ51277.1 phosphate:Na+ symporter [Alicyclobacillus montanus]
MISHLLLAFFSLSAFLSGLWALRYGLRQLASKRVEDLLEKLVRTPTRGIFTGTIVTALMQSSAAVTAIAVGLVSSGSLTFRSALGIVLGANVGSTVTPQMMQLNLRWLVYPTLVVGLLGLLSRERKWRFSALAAVGFSAVYLGLETLENALAPLSKSPYFAELLRNSTFHLEGAILCGILASTLLQSSTATTLVTMALVHDSSISLTSAIAIVLGANIGTCLTSVIASIGQSRAAVQVALFHVLLNIFGVLAIWPWIHPFSRWLVRLDHHPEQVVANAHTLFNVFSTLLVWPFTRTYARFIERLLPNQMNS